MPQSVGKKQRMSTCFHDIVYIPSHQSQVDQSLCDIFGCLEMHVLELNPRSKSLDGIIQRTQYDLINVLLLAGEFSVDGECSGYIAGIMHGIFSPHIAEEHLTFLKVVVVGVDMKYLPHDSDNSVVSQSTAIAQDHLHCFRINFLF